LWFNSAVSGLRKSGGPVLFDLAIALSAAILGFIAALWLLLLWVGDGAVAPETTWLDPIMGERDRVGIYESYGPFVPMPEHLKTHDEMVAWMTKELPRLTADRPTPRP
jgi:hypothetical protein